MSQSDILASLTGWNPPIFDGLANEDVDLWIGAICLELTQRQIPQENWAVIAMHFLGDEPRSVLEDAKMTLRLEKWDWNTLTQALIDIQKRMREDATEHSISVGNKWLQFRREHPYAAAAAGIGLITVGGITVAPAVLVGTLNLLGFSAAGVIGGSMAASIQSVVYGGAVASGSLFSVAQGAAMGGIAVASVPVQALSAGAIGLGAILFNGNGGAEQPDDASTATTDTASGDLPNSNSDEGSEHGLD